MCARDSGSCIRAVLDEISLEGLEGVTLPSLWVILAERFKTPISSSFKNQVWTLLLRLEDCVQFYVLPVERETLKIYNRYENVDPHFGVPMLPTECLLTRYKIVPIQDRNTYGSCEHYKTRKKISADKLRQLSVKDVLEKWGKKFVIVASQELRYSALTPPNVPRPKELTALQYTVWETIGRSRFNGETTAGPWSLLNICKDSTFVFYIKNKLIRNNVITHQSFNEKRADRLVVSTLLTLPRFFKAHKSRLHHVIEQLFTALKACPDSSMLTTEARKLFPSIEHPKAFRKITTTHLFRQTFETITVPYAEVFKDSKAKQKTVTKIKLRNPDQTIEDLFTVEINQKVVKTVEFQIDNNSHVDIPMELEFYRVIKSFGTVGVSQTELSNYIGLNHLSVRQVIKYLEREGMIKSYSQDIGRQRTNKYVVAENAEDLNIDKEASLQTLKNLQCAKEPNIPISKEVILADTPDIIATLKPMTYEYKSFGRRDTLTKRQVARKALTVRLIDEKCLIQMSDLRNSIQTEEKLQGHTDAVCRKSICRLLHQLSEQKIVVCYDITLKYDEHSRLYRYITHPKIDMEHDVLQREIYRLKSNFYLSIEERRLRAINSSKLAIARNAQKNRTPMRKAPTPTTEVVVPATVDGTMFHKTKPPKMLLARYLHEYFFYLVVELNYHQRPLEMNEKLLREWQRTEPNLKVQEYYEQWSKEEPRALPYARDISWRSFVPPLPKYEDKPPGWVYLMDALDRMPLSVFNKIFRIERFNDEKLNSLLTHPIRQHYLMRQLSIDIQSLISRIYLQRIYVSVMKFMTHIGIIQVTDKQSTKDPLLFWVYLNRKIKIMDTTSTEPGYAKINPKREYNSLKFEFASSDDVTQYWTNLQRVCLFTKLGLRRGKLEKGIAVKEFNFIRTIHFDDAEKFDTGEIPGDGCGAAGLGSVLFSHQFRNWSWVVQTNTRQTATASYSKTKNMSVSRAKQPKLMLTRKTRTTMPPIRRLYANSNDGGAHTSSRRPIYPKRPGPRDDVDRDALKNMRTLRVTWDREEDKMLKVARAVYLYVAAPVPALGLFTVGRITRDIIRHLLGSCNKTSQACLRRMQFLIRMKRDIPEVPNWLYVLQSNKELKRIYGDDFLQNLKRDYPVRTDYCEALSIHFVFIMNFLYNIINNKTSDGDFGNFQLPDNIIDYSKLLRERIPMSVDQVIHHKNPETEFELQVTLAQCVLHSTLCCARDKTLYNLQSFEIYKYFSEEVLDTAFAKSRSESLVVAIKRRNIQTVSRQVSGPAYLFSSKYRNRLAYLRMPYPTYDSFYDYFQLALRTFFGANEKEVEPTLDLKSPHIGQVLFIGEALAYSYLEAHIKLPINILTVDTSERQTISSTDRILDHYHSIFDNAPQTEYAKQIESENTTKQIRVLFHPANLSYRVYYNPYDYISKLAPRYLHFFCALDHIHQPVDINFSKLQRKDAEHGFVVVECPFNCILINGGNYINAIERIVHEKKLTLKDLSEMPPQKLLNQATSGNAVIVQPTNLLTLVRMLESFWREKEEENDRKDFGKISKAVKINRTIDWQQLCRDILSFDPNDGDCDKIKEYEPTLNKEERVVRAQDVFVVSLPTLQLKLSNKIREDTDFVQYQQSSTSPVMEVPKVLLECDIQRQAILEKVICDSYWKYTDNTFETLRVTLNDLNFNDKEQKHLEEIYNCIESHKLGMTAAELKREFPLGEFLLRALRTLAEHFLIKRVGVSTFMYVHKTNIRNWVVHTFHIKRLEREGLKTVDDVSGSSAQKRTHDDDVADQADDEEEDEIEQANKNSKKAKLDEGLSSGNDIVGRESKKRKLKPVQRYDEKKSSGSQENTLNITAPIKRDVIVMRPQPWMRVNGSLNRRVLDRWLGAILTECITHTGTTVHSIFLRFPHMLQVDIMFLIEILCDLKCIHLMEIQPEEIILETNFIDIIEDCVTDLYEPTNTYVVAHGDAVGRITNFIGRKNYNAEFI